MDECHFYGEVPVGRPAKPNVQSIAEIERIATTPMEQLSFQDFKNLKSGRDKYSKMDIMQLIKEIDWLDDCFLVAVFYDDLELESPCIRWMLGGFRWTKQSAKSELTSK